MNSKADTARLAAWLGLMLLAGIALAWRLTTGVSVQTDIRGLLPAQQLDPSVQAGIDQVQEQTLNQHLVLLGGTDLNVLKQAARQMQQHLVDSGAFVTQALPAPSEASVALYLAHPYRWLARSDETLSAEALRARAMSRLYGLAGLSSRTGFEQDPFAVLAQWLDQRPSYSPYVPLGPCLHRQLAQTHWCLLTFRASQPGMGLAPNSARQQALEHSFRQIRAQWPGIQLHDTGISRHADYAARTAKAEFSLISLGTLCGIVLLLGLLLRKLRALLLTALVLGSGGLLGLALCLLVYPQPHLIALVFGACLLGVAVDYAFHFLCAEGSGMARSRHIQRGLTLGWLTTSAGFAFLLLAPFDSLRQVAVFGLAGLAGAYISVRGLLPALPQPWYGPAATTLEQRVRSWHSLPPQRWPLVALTGLLLLALLASRDLHSGENVRALYASSPELLAQETKARQLLDGLDTSQLFVVQGQDAEALLSTSETLDTALRQAQATGALEHFMSISQALPSRATQARAHAHWQQQVFAEGAALDQLQGQLSLPPDWVRAHRQAAQNSSPLTLDTWRRSVASWPHRDLLIEAADNTLTALVRLGGIRDLAALQDIASDLQAQGLQVQWHDPLTAASQGLQRARQSAVGVLKLALLGVLLALLLRYGLRRGLISALPLALAICLCLAMLSLRGLPFNLFCVFALLLVVGMALDYAIFLRESRRQPGHSVLAVSLSALTTLLAFGLLGLSSTPALQSFGQIVSLGIGSAWLSTLLLYRSGWMNPP